MSASDCMPEGLVYDAGLSGCETSFKLLWSLAAFNLLSAVLSLFFGHDAIRRHIPSCSSSNEWKPWSSIVLTMIHPLAMALATITIRVNGFKPDIFLVFAIWTMRPRMTATPIWFLVSNCSRRTRNPYLWTFKDNIVEETILNIFSLPFAILFIVNRHDSQQGWCADSSDYLAFWDAFYIIAAAGVISLALLVCMALHYCCHSGRKYVPVPHNNMPVLSRFWKWTLIVAGFNMLVAFAGQWLLWGAFITNAGTDFCPGSLVGESATWAVALLTIALGRPLIGGPGGA
ncbi:hypothetical protein MMC28_010710 [Mycoblastus sanguinarius]|nr:hypothetical protein [Mycoblastus sanguinarius]